MPAGSAFRNGRNCQRYVGVDRASGFQMMRFDKLGFNALIEVYENFLFFDCKIHFPDYLFEEGASVPLALVMKPWSAK